MIIKSLPFKTLTNSLEETENVALNFGGLVNFFNRPKKLGRPEGFTVLVKSLQLSAGAGFVVVITNNIMTMPGLSKTPAANLIDVVDGEIRGIF